MNSSVSAREMSAGSARATLSAQHSAAAAIRSMDADARRPCAPGGAARSDRPAPGIMDASVGRLDQVALVVQQRYPVRRQDGVDFLLVTHEQARDAVAPLLFTEANTH